MISQVDDLITSARQRAARVMLILASPTRGEPQRLAEAWDELRTAADTLESAHMIVRNSPRPLKRAHAVKAVDVWRRRRSRRIVP